MTARKASPAEPNYVGLIDRLTRQVSRVAEALERLEENARPMRWYEVSWSQGTFGTYDVRPVKRSAEAGSEVEAKEMVLAEQTLSHEDQSMMTQIRVKPLRSEQCKYCCSVDWEEDDAFCRRCSYNEKDAIRARREGRYWYR